jgi:hypothetical protein
MSTEQLVKWEFAGETEVLWENLSQCHVFITNPTWPDFGMNMGWGGEKLVTKSPEWWHGLSSLQNQDWLYWWGPAAIYLTQPETVGSSCMTLRVTWQTNMVMSPMQLRTKNHCAGVDQQQFTQPRGLWQVKDSHKHFICYQAIYMELQRIIKSTLIVHRKLSLMAKFHMKKV